MIVQVIIVNSHTCLVFTTHVEVLEISGNSHTWHVWFLPSNQNEICFLQNCCLFLNRSLSQYSNLIFIFEFFGSLSTKTMLLHKFCFWYGNTILFYILYLDARFLKMSSIEMIRSNKETLQCARMCLGGMLVSQSLQYGAKTLFRHRPERHNFCHLTILRHWNIKMVAYMLSKNGWVMPFFVIFRLAREKLLVTVALDHPVPKKKKKKRSSRN